MRDLDQVMFTRESQNKSIKLATRGLRQTVTVQFTRLASEHADLSDTRGVTFPRSSFLYLLVAGPNGKF